MNYFIGQTLFGKDRNRDRRVVDTINNTVAADERAYLFVVGGLLYYNKDIADSYLKGLEAVRQLQCPITLILGEPEERIYEDVFDKDLKKYENFYRTSGITALPKKRLSLRIGGSVFDLWHDYRDCNIRLFNLYGVGTGTQRVTAHGISCNTEVLKHKPLSEAEIGLIIKDIAAEMQVDLRIRKQFNIANLLTEQRYVNT